MWRRRAPQLCHLSLLLLPSEPQSNTRVHRVSPQHHVGPWVPKEIPSDCSKRRRHAWAPGCWDRIQTRLVLPLWARTTTYAPQSDTGVCTLYGQSATRVHRATGSRPSQRLGLARTENQELDTCLSSNA